MPRRLRWALVLGTAGLALFVLKDKIPDGDELSRSMTGLSPGWLGVAVVAEAMSMATFARLTRRLLTLGGAHLTAHRAVALTYARNAVSNSLPAGPVLSIAYATRQFARLGAAKPLTAATLVLSGVYSTATFCVLCLIALLGEPSTRVPTGIALAVLIAAVSAVVLLRPRGLRDWLRRRSPGTFDQIRAARDAIRLAGRDRLVLIGLALANWLLDVACLAAVCAAAGVTIGPHTVLLAYVAAKVAAVPALIPGGLGVAELGLAGTLIAAGVTGGAAAAVVLLYRLISYWAVLLAGWLAWLLLLDGFRARLALAGHRLWIAFIRGNTAMNPCAAAYSSCDLWR
ncbi:YbhN family protein [Planotetraspora sp. GP83]|uniref:lysylphosphatidylglycerol synthase transmembrane domain-containing protein n=1 Tax=Planotetraspora sp. GP83 TaxID=3156264 RepID=UPI0035169A7C